MPVIDVRNQTSQLREL